MAQISRTLLLFLAIHLVSSIAGQDLEKRGPQGFLGMRGKKFLEGSSEYYKRRPQFFVGVKGKKNIYDLLDSSEFYKRAPMGFMGMRGKKDLYPEEFKRAPMGFVGMRGKKEILEEMKRAPMGFVGMRGKKDSFSDEGYPESFEYVPKRGSLIGQIDYSANQNQNYPVLNEILTQYINKLERQNSNEAVKETIEPQVDRITNEVEKRAASIHQFFGVRGKKSLQSKRPYDVSFRGKFIGVRGKKDLKSSGAQEIRFLLDAPLPKRKGAIGFIGMRGKKWTDESSSEMDTPN